MKEVAHNSQDSSTSTDHETSAVGGAFRNICRTLTRVFRIEKVVIGSVPRRVPARTLAKSADTLGQVQ